MVIGEAKEPLNILYVGGRRQVLYGLYVFIAHLHSSHAHLSPQELYSSAEQLALLGLKL